jgi:hypothetical protein
LCPHPWPGASTFTVQIGVAAQYAGQTVELHLDSTSGPMIGKLIVASTGSFSTFTAQSTAIQGATGIHDLYLVGKGSFGVGCLDSFTFSK